MKGLYPLALTDDLPPFSGEDSFQAPLSYGQEAGKIVSLELLSSGYNDLQGFVKEVAKDHCVLRQIEEYGEEDGTSIVELSGITRINCDSFEEQKLLLMHHKSEP